MSRTLYTTYRQPVRTLQREGEQCTTCCRSPQKCRPKPLPRLPQVVLLVIPGPTWEHNQNQLAGIPKWQPRAIMMSSSGDTSFTRPFFLENRALWKRHFTEHIVSMHGFYRERESSAQHVADFLKNVAQSLTQLPKVVLWAVQDPPGIATWPTTTHWPYFGDPRCPKWDQVGSQWTPTGTQNLAKSQQRTHRSHTHRKRRKRGEIDLPRTAKTIVLL